MLPPLMSAPWGIYAGDPSQITLTIMEGETPADLSATTITAQWRRTASAGDLIELGVTVDGAEVTVSVTEEQSRAMGRGGVFDVQGVTAGVVRTIVRGMTTWTLDVTRG